MSWAMVMRLGCLFWVPVCCPSEACNGRAAARDFHEEVCRGHARRHCSLARATDFKKAARRAADYLAAQRAGFFRCRNRRLSSSSQLS